MLVVGEGDNLGLERLAFGMIDGVVTNAGAGMEIVGESVIEGTGNGNFLGRPSVSRIG